MQVTEKQQHQTRQTSAVCSKSSAMQAVVLGSVATLQKALQQPPANLAIQMLSSGALSFPEAAPQAGAISSVGLRQDLSQAAT